jgi:hypothetical protein
LKTVRLLRGEPRDLLFARGAWGRGAVRSPVKRAEAHLANGMGRSHPVPLRSAY